MLYLFVSYCHRRRTRLLTILATAETTIVDTADATSICAMPEVAFNGFLLSTAPLYLGSAHYIFAVRAWILNPFNLKHTGLMYRTNVRCEDRRPFL